MSIETREDGVWFRAKKVPTALYSEALELVKNKIVSGVSPGFTSIPRYENGVRVFDEIQINEISLAGRPSYESSLVHARESSQPKYRPRPPELFK